MDDRYTEGHSHLTSAVSGGWRASRVVWTQISTQIYNVDIPSGVALLVYSSAQFISINSTEIQHHAINVALISATNKNVHQACKGSFQMSIAACITHKFQDFFFWS